MAKSSKPREWHDLHCRVPRDLWEQAQSVRGSSTSTELVCEGLRLLVEKKRPHRGKK